MEVDGAMIHDYYRRAFQDANPLWRRQDSTLASQSTESTASVASTSSTASSSSTSTSTSTSSTSSTTSTTSSPSSTTSLSSITAGSTTMSSAIQTTDSSGNVFTTTLVIVPSVTPTQTAPSNKSTNTGAIVGGVVGGVAVIALIIIGGVLIRRKMKKDEFEANIFDPDRNVERPTSIPGGRPGNNFDIAGAGLGAAAGTGAAAAASDRASHVTPYSYAPTSTGPASTYHGSSVAGAPEMSQAHSPISSGYYSSEPNYGNNTSYPNQYPNYNQYQPIPSIGVGESFPNPYGPGYQPAAGYGGQAAAAGLGAAAGAGAVGLARNQTASSAYPATSEGRSSPSASPPPGAAATLAPGAPLNPRAAKEREAFGNRSNYNVSNPNDPTAVRNPSPTPSRTSGQGPTSPVTVHQDGGRVPDEEDDQGEAEIPPTYDSIPRDTR